MRSANRRLTVILVTIVVVAELWWGLALLHHV